MLFVNRLEGQALRGGEKPLFTISEVGRVFGLSVQTLHYWLKSGRIRRSQAIRLFRIPRCHRAEGGRGPAPAAKMSDQASTT